MIEPSTHILIAEDMEENRFALKRLFKKSKYKDNLTFANDGLEAWSLLEKEPNKYDIALLDRMMPNMDGLELLTRMRNDVRFKNIPIVFQTAMAQIEEINNGLSAGAFYYITKPYPARAEFISTINSAMQVALDLKELKAEIDGVKQVPFTAKHIDIKIQKLEEIKAATSYISKLCPNPEKVSLGLSELLLNAIEHGNCGITYDEKTQLNNEERWIEEVNLRLELAENKNKLVAISFSRSEREICIVITDEGHGFSWKDYLDISIDRAFDNHGRGIAMAKLLSFDRVEYKGVGNEVHAIVTL